MAYSDTYADQYEAEPAPASQFARPYSDIQTGSWIAQPTPSEALYLQLRETSPDIADYIESVALGR